MRDPTRRGGPEVLDTKRVIARSDTGPAMLVLLTDVSTAMPDVETADKGVQFHHDISGILTVSLSRASATKPEMLDTT